uniref:Phenylalanine--tRNA ligase beta subunit n=1 Tax=uncultured Rhodobacterales bacterium TaxID=293400 RepID=A0A0U1ZDM2_9RHOB|nr:phenylalanyl-tRNA synthetase beta chain [uncultured Rhodobacterales bacterium]
MKFTLSWLKRHLETTATAEEIAAALTDLGLEVESIDNPLEALKAFRLGHVTEATPHPDADRLRVCRVETADGPKQIICGAPNARAGITVVIATPGDYIPGIATTIGVGKIRGVESHGMMCSEREMGLSDEHDGIIELPSGRVGERFTDWLAENDPAKVDPVIEIAVTPNRPDALGVRGIARDLAARGLGTLKAQDVEPVPASFTTDFTVTIDADTLDGCPLFCGRVIRGVKNGPSPRWLQDALRAIGLRPISLLVDVTNFFTFDRNRPLHVFDLDKISGNLRVHRAAGGETLVALDEKEYALRPGQMVISDDNGPESIAGIIGGLKTGCDDSTVNVFVESAYWNPVEIALTGRALRVVSDARYRFERGVDPAFTPEGLEHAVRMITDHAGGKASRMIVAGEVPKTGRAYRLAPDRVRRLVGMDIPAETQRATLKALGFRLEGDIAHVPSWRPDVTGEADLVEEVARVASLAGLKGVPLPRPAGVTGAVLTPAQRRERTARRTIAALGYSECVSYSFIDRKSAEMFGGRDAPVLENPISGEMSHMRPSLLPGLMQAAARNQARGVADLALFEIGPVWHGGEPEDQALVATGLLVGHTGPRDHLGSRRPMDMFDAKADIEALLGALGAPVGRLGASRDVNPWWHPGRAARLLLGPKTVLGAFGVLHPGVVAAMGVRGPVVAFAVHPDNIPLPRNRSTGRSALKASDLQAVERDFAFVVDSGVAASTLVAAAAGADKALIEEVRVFDEFTGGGLGEGRKSLAISVRLQPTDKTLTDKDIEAVSAKIVGKVGKATGGVLRE